MEAMFKLANLAVLPFWLAMILAPGWRGTARLMARPWGVLAPILIYAGLVLPRLPEILPVVARPELGPVTSLLGTPAGATIAWAHFLAFDLFVGRWIYLDARQRGLSGWMTAPILLTTLMLGPIGLGSYGLVLAARRLPTGNFNRPLALLALGSMVLLVASGVLMMIDHRQVMGVSTWLKPAKFGISVAIVSGTLALLLRQMTPLGRAGRRLVGLAAGLLALELVIITAQAARGVPSHFNASTPLDQTLFAIMGAAIAVVTLLVGWLAVRSFRQPFANPALGWGIRLGLVVMVLGASVGWLMTRPTASQLDGMRAGERPTLVGAHAVGAPDGGPGLPLTRWSTEGGDLRVPHFLGLHALQLLPLGGWWLGRRRQARASADGARIAARRTIVAGAAYAGLVGVTLVQALRGQPLTKSDALTLALLALVLAAGAVGWWWAGRLTGATRSARLAVPGRLAIGG